MKQVPTVANFSSWSGLAPDNNEMKLTSCDYPDVRTSQLISVFGRQQSDERRRETC